MSAALSSHICGSVSTEPPWPLAHARTAFVASTHRNGWKTGAAILSARHGVPLARASAAWASTCASTWTSAHTASSSACAAAGSILIAARVSADTLVAASSSCAEAESVLIADQVSSERLERLASGSTACGGADKPVEAAAPMLEPPTDLSRSVLCNY
eukprot:5731034-Prymnesium_polylepis.3